ncbi:RNA polymerase sigma factor [Hyalangium gracile]|uniref:RNA polymerase sigma factor n=1 Tax=Hyalangium gracile TaxID=394092 RepID=UPI001CCCF7CC|nr:RNA polymerase sigma factor [Hyalangium gracile]
MPVSPDAAEAVAPWLEQLLARRRPWLLAQAVNLCRNRSDAEDLVQETIVRFLAAFGHVTPPPEEGVCANWLVTTLTHCFYDQLRKQRTRERGAEELTREEPTVEPEPPERSLFDRISDEQFSSAVRSLSPVARTTFEMHARGRKYKEIAEELGIREGTVAKRLHDARSKLRALLEPFIRLGDN